VNPALGGLLALLACGEPSPAPRPVAAEPSAADPVRRPTIEAEGLELQGAGWSLRARRARASGPRMRAEGLSLEAELAGDRLLVRAPRGDVDLGGRTARLEGGVALARGELSARADGLDATWGEGSLPGALQALRLRGDVDVSLPTPGALRGRAEAPPQESRAYADTAALSPESGTLVLEAAPGGRLARLEEGTMRLQGARVGIDLFDGSARCEGDGGAVCVSGPVGAP
jgi:hypothetical protein